MRLLILAALAAAACASVQPAPSAARDGDDTSEARAAEARSSRLEQQLRALFAGVAPRDCSRACEIAEEICGLSERICSIAERHRDDVDLGARCVSGRQRCERSREAARAGCDCRR